MLFSTPKTCDNATIVIYGEYSDHLHDYENFTEFCLGNVQQLTSQRTFWKCKWTLERTNIINGTFWKCQQTLGNVNGHWECQRTLECQRHWECIIETTRCH